MPVDPWIEQHIDRLPEAGLVLDLACGKGRHSLLAAKHKHPTVSVDRSATALAEILSTTPTPPIETLAYDLEAQPWPFPPAFFDGILVCNYLHRPLFSHIREALAPGGVLIYSTFAEGNEVFGRPSNPDFLLRTDELKNYFSDGCEILDFFQGQTTTPQPAMRQSIAVRKLEPSN